MAALEELEDRLVELIRQRRENRANLSEYADLLLRIGGKISEQRDAQTDDAEFGGIIIQLRGRSQASAQTPANKMGYAEKMEKLMRDSPNAYNPWDSAQEKQLSDLYNGGKTISEISAIMQRQKGGIRSRLKRLGLIKSQPVPEIL